MGKGYVLSSVSLTTRPFDHKIIYYNEVYILFILNYKENIFVILYFSDKNFT